MRTLLCPIHHGLHRQHAARGTVYCRAMQREGCSFHARHLPIELLAPEVVNAGIGLPISDDNKVATCSANKSRLSFPVCTQPL